MTSQLQMNTPRLRFNACLYGPSMFGFCQNLKRTRLTFCTVMSVHLSLLSESGLASKPHFLWPTDINVGYSLPTETWIWTSSAHLLTSLNFKLSTHIIKLSSMFHLLWPCEVSMTSGWKNPLILQFKYSHNKTPQSSLLQTYVLNHRHFLS